MQKSCLDNPWKKGDILDIGELLSLLPDIFYEYSQVMDDRPLRLIQLKGPFLMGMDFNISKYKEEFPDIEASINKAYLKEYPALKGCFEWKPNETTYHVTDNESLFLISLNIVHILKDGIYLSLGHKIDENYVWYSRISLLYGLCFALSNLVRYYPPKWDGMIGKVNNPARIIVDRITQIALEEFPKLTLAYMMGDLPVRYLVSKEDIIEP